MKLIEPKAELLLQPEGLEGVYKQIELCGRTCYKSTDKITDESAKPFVERMIASKHTAMLEQGTIYLATPMPCLNDPKALECKVLCMKYQENPYSKVVYNPELVTKDTYCYRYYITTNYRVLIENGWLDDLQYMCEPTKYHEKRYTIKFNADIHFYKEATRHRPLSYAIESTRFCNYLKKKFGMSVSFMCPSWLTEQFRDEFEEDCKTLEQIYFKWINKGLRAEQAAYFLCQGTAAEVCITGFASDWRFFFDLRYYGETGKPHPDMELLASKARDEFIKAGLWDDIMSYPLEFRDGSIVSALEEKKFKPKFKVDDVIQMIDAPQFKSTIKKIKNEGYLCNNDFITFDQEHKWELVMPDIKCSGCELQESEDEKIRKSLIDMLKNDEKCYLKEIAWLEKQGEQKPVFEMKTPEESLGIDSDTYNKIVDECIYGEQKPAWSEEDEEIVEALNDYVKNLDILFSEIKIGGKDIISKEFREKVQHWLKSLRPQNKYAYNPYKAVVESIAAMVEKYAPFDSNLQDFYDNVKVKCKDAKEYDSLYPQNTWKPSDEQMEALEHFVRSIGESGYVSQYDNNTKLLYSLLFDLKKL